MHHVQHGVPQEWNDVHREILVMRQVKHPNIVAFKGCYCQELEIWVRAAVS
jgi:serine/threonine protein kinase